MRSELDRRLYEFLIGKRDDLDDVQEADAGVSWYHKRFTDESELWSTDIPSPLFTVPELGSFHRFSTRRLRTAFERHKLDDLVSKCDLLIERGSTTTELECLAVQARIGVRNDSHRSALYLADPTSSIRWRPRVLGDKVLAIPVNQSPGVQYFTSRLLKISPSYWRDKPLGASDDSD